jgi:hypothetical protein
VDDRPWRGFGSGQSVIVLLDLAANDTSIETITGLLPVVALKFFQRVPIRNQST